LVVKPENRDRFYPSVRGFKNINLRHCGARTPY
jgi:hypothetical protein